MRPVDFLYKVWSQVAKEGDYVFLSIKSPRWTDSYFQFNSSIKGRVRDWLRQHNPKEMDVYFCPLPFSAPERLAKYVKPVNILWSDVDDGDPKKLRPTILWESSPGRHHALWFLKDRMNAEDASQLNKSVTYHLGADKGGWDLSQVLRIPGTFNHKYNSKPEVKLLHWDDKKLSADVVAAKVKHKLGPKPEEFTGDTSHILKNYNLSNGVLNLLNGEAEEGRRSDVMWYLENKLHEAGMSPDEIISVIKESDWNKFKGRHDEDDRIRNELSKVVEKSIETKPKKKLIPTTRTLKIQTFSEVMSSLQSNPGWQVPGFWMRRSHGMVAGEPKSFKSTFAMDMGLSIAAPGTKFLGKYPVEQNGPVLYVQNENAEWIMKDRFEKMLKHKGLVGKVSITGPDTLNLEFPPEIPFYMVNQQNFILTNEDQQEFLEETIKQMKPELVILDPLYLMFDGDIASAQELFPVLQWLLYLKVTYNCGIMLIHHWNKGGDSKRGGQRMLGSTTLHGLIESALYLKTNPTDIGDAAEIVMEREFRGTGLHNKLEIQLEMGDMGDPYYKVEVEDYQGDPEESQPTKRANPERMLEEILGAVSQRKGVTESQIAGNTGYNAKQVRDTLDQMIGRGECYRESGKVYLRKTA